MTRKQWLLSSVVAFTTLVSTAVIAGPIENYSPVTSARLENPEPENWLMARGNYQAWSHSPLAEITPENVNRLQLVWIWAMNDGGASEPTPIVHTGMPGVRH